MNSIVAAWQKHEKTDKYSGPDSAMLLDVKFVLKEEEMPVQTELPKNQMNNVLRLIKTASLDQVKALKTATYNELKRLGAKRDGRKAARKIPSGSDQGDIMSIVQWMSRVSPADKKAVDQIIKIDATCCRRVGG